MAEFWAEKGHRIFVLTIADKNADFFPLPEKIKRIGLDLMQQSQNFFHGLWLNLQRILKIRNQVRFLKPDVIVSFVDQTNILVLLSTIKMPVPVIVSERTNPAKHQIGRFWGFLRKIVYPFSTAAVVQTQAVKNWLLSSIKMSNRVVVIPNSLVNPASINKQEIASAFMEKYSHKIIAVGRLGFEKGFDLLIESFSLLAEDFPDWGLLILGEGNERKNLEKMVFDKGLSDRVLLPGRVECPAAYMKRSDVFVLSSRYEGFPNVLLEAMGCGLPVISFDCPNGPGEIITDGLNGILVENGSIDALTLAMRNLLADGEKRRELGGKASEVLQKYSQEKIMQEWEALISAACGKFEP
jgi:glycosyltransferase involved in cell wall biosynthesis